jgi:hypothetical protein
MRLDDRHTMTDGLPLKRHVRVSTLDGMTTTTTPATTTTSAEPTHHVFHPDPAKVRRAIERRSVATLATVSGKGRPHAATVLYQCVDDALFVSTHRESRKARNVADNGVAAVTIAVRRLPIGPPASIQFQSSAAVLTNDDPDIVRLAEAGMLGKITAHGELDLDGGCFLRLALPRAPSPTRWECPCGESFATHSTQPARSTCARARGRTTRDDRVAVPTSLSQPMHRPARRRRHAGRATPAVRPPPGGR